MSAAEKKKAKEKLKDKGFKYASDLSYTGAQELLQIDIETQLDEIKNKYVIKEDGAENNNIALNTEYTSGKTIELGNIYSWRKNEDNEWPDVADGTYSNYIHAYPLPIVNKYKKTTVLVKKKDGYSADGKSYGSAGLEGAAFRVYQDANCTKLAPLLDYNGNKIQNKEYVIKDGKFETDYLRCGVTYYLKETKTPTGYQSNTTVIPFELDGKNLSNEYTKNGKVVEVTNQPILGKVAIQKYYSEGKTGKLKAEPGAKFQIYLKNKGNYEKCNEYERDLITTDKDGYAQTKNLYYGRYVVHQQSTGGLDTKMVADFDVEIKEHGKLYHYALNDTLFEAYLRIVKKDANTKQTVLKSGTTYQIYQVDEKTGKETLVTQSTSNGRQIVQIDRFQTNESGTIMTVKPLVSGIYRVYEIEAASGLHISTPYVQVNINSKENNYVREVDAEGNVHMTVEVDYPNEETYGKLYLSKIGEQLAGYDALTGKFLYEKKPLEGAVFEIYAAEDIVTQDNQGTTWYQKGELVDTVVTKSEVVTINLPLGKYEIKETDTKYGYVLSDKKSWHVEFDWMNKTEEYVFDSSGVTDENGVLLIENERAKAQIEIEKKDSTNRNPISDVTFGLFNKDSIYNSNGELIVKEGTKLGEIKTDKNGTARFDLDVPLMSEDYVKTSEKLNSGEYYVQELSASKSYYVDKENIPIHLEYKDKESGVVYCKIEKDNVQTKATVNKFSLTGTKEIPDCHLKIVDKSGNKIVSWVSADKDSIMITEKAKDLGYENLYAEVDKQGSLKIGGLFYGEEYTLSETKPADGFVTAEEVKFSLSEDKSIENKVIMRDDTTKVEFRKVDAETKKMISGAGIFVYDSKGIKVCSFITEKDKAQRIDGILKVGETYTFKEEQVPAGYTKAEDVKLTIQDTANIQTIQMEDRPFITIKENKIPQNLQEDDSKKKRKIEPEKVPLTGDKRNPTVYLITMLVALLAIALIGKKKTLFKLPKE